MRIALIGSAPSSIHLAPYDDPSWTIWGCSPGGAHKVRRADAWFELHPYDPLNPQARGYSPDYIAFLRSLKVPVYLTDPIEGVSTGALYPKDEMLQRFGRYFFTSSLSWMFAFALIQPEVTEIGIWGVDMSATEEYGYQRAGCHHFIDIAQRQGIKVTTPPESDLIQPPPLYGFESPMMMKLKVRKAELERRIAEASAAVEEKSRELLFLRGALDDLEYIRNTWAG